MYAGGRLQFCMPPLTNAQTTDLRFPRSEPLVLLLKSLVLGPQLLVLRLEAVQLVVDREDLLVDHRHLLHPEAFRAEDGASVIDRMSLDRLAVVGDLRTGGRQWGIQCLIVAC